MHKIQPLKTQIQLFFIMFMTAVVLVSLSLLVGTGVRPQMVVAQEPLVSPDPLITTFSLETLEAYGLSAADIQAAATLSFTLQVKVSASATSVDAGNPVTFTTTITNLGPDTAQYIFFSSTLPTCLSGVTTNFGLVDYHSNNAAPPTYLLISPIAVGSPIQIKVSGQTTACGTGTITYKAFVSYINQPSGALYSASMGVMGDEYLTYLPVIRRDPTPTPTPTPTAAFYDDFSDDDWTTADSDECSRSYTNGEYQIKAEEEDKDCFSPAPDDAEYEEGTFKVEAYRSGGSKDYTVALYINGKGAKNYYALEVRPKNDTWKLIRVHDEDSSTRKSGTSSVINESGKNTLQLKHVGKYIYVSINGTQLSSYYADDDEDEDMEGYEGTGLYVRMNDDESSVSIRFDNFYVIKP